MRISTLTYYESAYNQLQNLQNQVNSTQARISQNTNLLNAADDPVKSSQILTIEAKLANIDQYKKNLQSVVDTNNQESSVLDSLTSILNRVKEITVQSNNSTISTQDRSQLSDELGGLIKQINDLINSKDSNGNYLFSGTFSGSDPFKILNNQPQAYQGNQSHKTVKVSDQSSVEVSQSGDELFASIPINGVNVNMISYLNDLKSQVSTQNNVEIKLTSLDGIIDHIASASASIGDKLKILDNWSSFHDNISSSLQASLSTLKDADLTSEATKLNFQTLSLQAAQASFAKLSNLSVFNYL